MGHFLAGESNDAATRQRHGQAVVRRVTKLMRLNDAVMTIF
jgi:hypothetical protein